MKRSPNSLSPDEGDDTRLSVRLFTALTVPGDLRAQLAALPRKGLDANWTHPDDFHITIRFLGDVAEDRLPDIADALSRVRRNAFTVEVRGLGVFENKKQAILHAAVGSTKKLEALCADTGDALTPLGFDFGTRAFVPHVTLARVKTMRGVSDYIARHGHAVSARWQAREFHLMRSASPGQPEGKRYSILQSWPLAGQSR